MAVPWGIPESQLVPVEMGYAYRCVSESGVRFGEFFVAKNGEERRRTVMQYQIGAGNPFAVLTAIVAPAILTNASSVLALGTSNRLGRVVDRTRVVYGDLAATEPGSLEHQEWTDQLRALQKRGEMLLRALRLFYATLGLFATTALVSVADRWPHIMVSECCFVSAWDWRC
jgi:hypothetical protein